MLSLIKEKYLSLLRKKYFPCFTKKKKVMFIPILIDEENNDIVLFSENGFYNNWIKE